MEEKNALPMKMRQSISLEKQNIHQSVYVSLKGSIFYSNGKILKFYKWNNINNIRNPLPSSTVAESKLDLDATKFYIPLTPHKPQKQNDMMKKQQ